MIQLDYELSEPEAEIASELADAEQLELHYYHFRGNLTLKINQLDLSARWGWVPILDAAVAFAAIVDALATSGALEEFEFTESTDRIRFQRDDDVVRVSASYIQGETAIDHAELQVASSQFRTRVLNDLVARFPELRTNPYFAELTAVEFDH